MSDEVSHGFGAAMVPDDGLSEEVDVDLDDMGTSPVPPAAAPASVSTAVAAPAPAKPPSASNPESGAVRASEPPKKARPRMSLRVPDDEVVRPQTNLSRTGETRVFRSDELERDAASPAPVAPPATDGASAGAPSGIGPRPASVMPAAAPVAPPPAAPEPPRPRAPSMTSEAKPVPPRPRAASITNEAGAPPAPPRPRAPSITNEAPNVANPSASTMVAAPPRPRAPSVTNEAPPAIAPGPPRPPARSINSEVTRVAPMAPPPAESAPLVEPEREDDEEIDDAPTREIQPARIISVHPEPPAMEDIPTDLPTLTDLPAVRDSVDGLAAAAEGARDSADGIPIEEDVEPFELRNAARNTDLTPPPEPGPAIHVPRITAARAPALTIPDSEGGIDIPVDEDADPVDATGEHEVASDDLLSIESAPEMPPGNGKATPAVARAVPPVGMSSDTNVAAKVAQTPPGGVQAAVQPRAAAPVATGAPAPAPAAAPAAVPVVAAAPAAAPAGAPPASTAAPSSTAAPASTGAPVSPRIIVPPHASPLAPQPLTDAAANRKRQRPWWEELFNDDFIRTMAKITDEQIAREVDFIEDSLGVARGAMILDMACGTGRHAIELTRRGYRVVGLDLSLAMLAKAAEEAQERNQKLNFVQGDMREMTFDDMFDGVYCWNTSFGFFDEERNAAVIQRVHRALRKGGQFVLDVMNRDFALQQQPSLVWFEGEGCICMDEMQIDWITSRMRVKRTMMMDDGRSREIEYSLRIYSLHELGKMLHDHGFRVAEVSGRVSTPGVFFGAESPNVLILAEKR